MDPHRSVHPDAGVAYLRLHIPAGWDLWLVSPITGLLFDVGGLEGELSALWHGVAGIDGQVEEDLFQYDTDECDLVGSFDPGPVAIAPPAPAFANALAGRNCR